MGLFGWEPRCISSTRCQHSVCDHLRRSSIWGGLRVRAFTRTHSFRCCFWQRFYNFKYRYGITVLFWTNVFGRTTLIYWDRYKTGLCRIQSISRFESPVGGNRGFCEFMTRYSVSCNFARKSGGWCYSTHTQEWISKFEDPRGGLQMRWLNTTVDEKMQSFEMC